MDDKRQKRLARQLAFAATKMPRTYLSLVARSLQSAVVYEAGAFVGNVKHMQDGALTTSYSTLGQVICITCGKSSPANSSGTHGGHYLSGRGASYVLEEVGINPQCFVCNKHRSGNHEQYHEYMLAVWGSDVVVELTRLKTQVTVKWDTETLALRRLRYMDRVAAAKAKIQYG